MPWWMWVLVGMVAGAPVGYGVCCLLVAASDAEPHEIPRGTDPW